MARKITDAQISQMRELYEELGTYAAVAKQLGVSPATVSKYIKQRNVVKTYTSCTIQPIKIEDTDPQFIRNFTHQTIEEKDSYNKWLEEFE